MSGADDAALQRVHAAHGVHGHCDDAFLRVRDAFANNFVEHGERGAACAIYVDGRKVVDLWGGSRDEQGALPWEAHTLVGFYSVGKPLAALCTLQLVDDGLLELDAPVARWWPEFAAEGKQDVSVRQLLCHQAGLVSIRHRLPEGAMLDWDLMTKALAAERPFWEPGTRSIYHTNTYGFLVGELARCITGEKPGAHLRNRIAGPLDADVAFGLPERDLSRVAHLHWMPTPNPPGREVRDRLFADATPPGMSEEKRRIWLGYMNPSGFSGLGVMNTRAWRMGEVPSTNGHGTARGVARIYDVMARGGSEGALRLLSPGLLAEASSAQYEGYCPALERETTFGLGFKRTRPDRPFGAGLRSFGHFGAGGSLGFADPDARVGFGYVMNHVIPRWQSPRNRSLMDALYACPLEAR